MTHAHRHYRPDFLALLALLAGSTSCLAAATGSSAPAGAQAVLAAKPVSVDLKRNLLATGSVQAWQEMIVASEVGGYQVESVTVEIGDHVKRGQELVRLSAALLESQIAVARASVSQAEASLANTKAALGRGEALASTGALSKSDLDTLRWNAASSEANLATAQANLQSAELRLRLTHVRAPDDGVITARSVNLGQVVQPGVEMLRLLRRGRVEWRAEVPEADMRNIRKGQKVSITTVEGTALAGTVRSVAPTVQSSNRTGLVYVDIPGSGAARPGMFARGEIEIGRAAVLMVPVGSVLVQDGYSYVFVIRPDSTVQRRRVQTGTVQVATIEIASGLEATELVVASGVAFLRDGQRVSVQPAA